LRTCRRTSMFLLFLFLESTKTMGFYPLQNQSSAAGSQGDARFWCILIFRICPFRAALVFCAVRDASRFPTPACEPPVGRVEMLSSNTNGAALGSWQRCYEKALTAGHPSS